MLLKMIQFIFVPDSWSSDMMTLCMYWWIGESLQLDLKRELEVSKC